MTMSNTKERVRSNARRTAHTLSEQSSRIADEVRELGHLAFENAGDALESLRHRGGDVLERAKERGSDVLHEGRERVQRARSGVEGYVAANPMKSVLLAAGVGAFVGYTLHARAKRRREERVNGAETSDQS